MAKMSVPIYLYIPYHFEWLYIQSWQKNRKNEKNIEKKKMKKKKMLGTISGALARSLIYIYISRKTLRSLRPEIGEFAGRAGEDRAVEDRAGEDMAGHGRTWQGRGTYQKRTEQKQSRAWAKSRAGHDGHCAI